jgi:hypothetical protein
MNEKLEKANKLQKEINELENFLMAVTRFDKECGGIPSVNVIMTKVANVKVSIFGSRYFGCGTHTQTVLVPNQVRNDLLEWVNNRLHEKENELSILFS